MYTGDRMISIKDYEGFGEGFGISEQRQVDELNKSLEAGYQITSQTGGSALRPESLENTLKVVTYQNEHIKFWRAIPKSPAYSTVEEYNRRVRYGGRGGAFIQEGALPRSEDSEYARKTALVKFLGTTREITHPMQLVRSAHGNVVALETQAGALWILEKLEEALFFANSDHITEEFDGLDKLIVDGLLDSTAEGRASLRGGSTGDASIIDLRGEPMSEAKFEEAAEIIQLNAGMPTDFWSSTKAISDFVKTFYPKERYSMPAPREGVVGLGVNKVITSVAPINLNPDIFLAPIKGAPAAASNSSAPTAPASVTVTVQAVTTSRGFLPAEYGTYYYTVTAVSKSGESTSTNGNVAAVVAAAGSAEVKLVIARGVQAGNDQTSAYRIYRSELGGAAANMKFIAQVASAGASTTFLDGNESLPGLSSAYMIQQNAMNLNFRQLAPMLKMPLARIASADRWMQLLYGVPILYTPRKNVIFRNIGEA